MTELRGKLGFSDPEEGDEIAGGAPVPPAVRPGSANRARSVALNRAQAEDLLDGIETGMLADWQELGSELEAAVAEAVDGASSYEAVLERLPEALRQMPSALLIDTLVKGMFQARAVGDAQDD
jgi:phage gp29-like protein